MSVHLIQQGHLLTKTLPLTTLSTHILIKIHAHAHTHQASQKAVIQSGILINSVSFHNV